MKNLGKAKEDLVDGEIFFDRKVFHSLFPMFKRGKNSFHFLIDLKKETLACYMKFEKAK